MVEDSPYPGQAGIQDPALEDKHKAGRERGNWASYRYGRLHTGGAFGSAIVFSLSL